MFLITGLEALTADLSALPTLGFDLPFPLFDLLGIQFRVLPHKGPIVWLPPDMAVSYLITLWDALKL